MKLKPKKLQVVITKIVLFILGVTLFCLWQNNSIVTTYINYHNNKLSKEFNGYTIVQISDLHNKRFGNNQKALLDQIKNTLPDIIVITGDLIDRNHTDLDAAMEFITGAVKIAPVYNVPGNHEAWSDRYEELKQKLLEANVILLEGSQVKLVKNDASIKLMGVLDPKFMTSSPIEGSCINQFSKELKTLLSDNDQSFKILLSHRPELIDLYAENNIDLVFTGHAHGGQFRIPFVGGLIAPDQGFFPKYTSGAYNIGNTTMIVNRGLGKSIIPIRIFNRPEIIVVTLNIK